MIMTLDDDFHIKTFHRNFEFEVKKELIGLQIPGISVCMSGF